MHDEKDELSPRFDASSVDLQDIDALFSRPGVARQLQQTSPTAYQAASRFWRTVMTGRALSPRLKELILLSLHGTITALNRSQIERQIKRALAAGASKNDILDVFVTITGVANHALYFALPVLMHELESQGHPQSALPPMEAEAQAIKDDFISKRGFWNEKRDMVAQLMPEYFSALSEISTESWVNGGLSKKERELICIAIDCSVTHMFEQGLAIHIRNALQQGASREEILEVFALASVTGLEGLITASETLFT